MKTRIFIFTAILLGASYIFSQDEIGLPKLTPEKGHWSIGSYGSVNLSLFNEFSNENASKPGYGGSVEVSYNKKGHGFLLNFGLTQIFPKPDNEHFDVFEIMAGPRINLTKTNPLFLDLQLAGLSIGITKRLLYDYDLYYDYYNREFEMGISLGVGKVIYLNKSNDLAVKVRFISSMTHNRSTLAYISAYTGLIFKSKKDTGPGTGHSNYGVSLWAGAANPDMFERFDHDWQPSGGIELNYTLGENTELIANAIYNKVQLNEKNETYRHSILSVTAGGRFLVGGRSAAGFMEFGGGMYSYTYQYGGPQTGEYYGDTYDYPGMNIGAGLKFTATTLIDFLVRANTHFLFSKVHLVPPNYLSVQGGIRFNL